MKGKKNLRFLRKFRRNRAKEKRKTYRMRGRKKTKGKKNKGIARIKINGKRNKNIFEKKIRRGSVIESH